MVYGALEVAKCIIPFGVNSLTLQRILCFEVEKKERVIFEWVRKE